MEGELVRHDFGLVVLQEIDYFSQGWRVAIHFLYRLEKREVKLSRANYIIKNKREKIFSRRGNLLLVFDIQLRVARSFTFELVADALIFRRSTSSRGGFDGKKKERRKEKKNWGRMKTRLVRRILLSNFPSYPNFQLHRNSTLRTDKYEANPAPGSSLLLFVK